MRLKRTDLTVIMRKLPNPVKDLIQRISQHIEPPELDQQLQQAEADLKSAAAPLEIADITNTRWQKLVAKRAVSMQEADQAKSDFVGKQAIVAAGEANVRRLKRISKK